MDWDKIALGSLGLMEAAASGWAGCSHLTRLCNKAALSVNCGSRQWLPHALLMMPAKARSLASIVFAAGTPVLCSLSASKTRCEQVEREAESPQWDGFWAFKRMAILFASTQVWFPHFVPMAAENAKEFTDATEPPNGDSLQAFPLYLPFPAHPLHQ